MSNVSSVYNMTHRNEIRLVWFHTEHVSTHNDTKFTFGGGYNLYRHSHSTWFFFCLYGWYFAQLRQYRVV